MNEILTRIGVSLISCMILLIIVVSIVNIYGEITGATNCAYCRVAIAESADYVCMTDGRKMHAECYMRAIMENAHD